MNIMEFFKSLPEQDVIPFSEHRDHETDTIYVATWGNSKIGVCDEIHDGVARTKMTVTHTSETTFWVDNAHYDEESGAILVMGAVVVKCGKDVTP